MFFATNNTNLHDCRFVFIREIRGCFLFLDSAYSASSFVGLRYVLEKPLRGPPAFEWGDSEGWQPNGTHFRFLIMKYGPPSPREFGRVHLKLDQA